ncbi:MAG: glycine/betaine ABC transporter ATP-binding protein [Gammaproteobacteria bacterium]|nr:glycine/betaine ABC transporter ATP-binding protein [Gammaproteobacteria bacterium]
MIELKNVRKSYDGGRSFAVSDVCLRVNRGELLGLIGESGCGKTSTLKMINRLEEPSSGEILVNGENVRRQNAEQLRRNIGYVFQGIGLFPHYTVAQNVSAVPELLGWSPSAVLDRCRVVLDLVGLPPTQFAERFPSQLSGGQQQRVGVARALAAQPQLVLMDEPFGALDPITRADLQDEFKSIQRRLELTVILVTHDMTEALLMADRIAVMKQGKVQQLGSPTELLNAPSDPYVRKLIEMPKQRADRLDQILAAHSRRGATT